MLHLRQNASSGLGIDVEGVAIVSNLEHSNIPEELYCSSSPNVDIIPSHIDLVAIEIEL
jgi:chromosome partitioning protein